MGGQTHPTFHPTLVFSMLDEMLDAFDQGLSHTLSVHQSINSDNYEYVISLRSNQIARISIAK